MNAAWEKLPCSCFGEKDADGYIYIAAEGFLCEAKHKQGDLVEVREGLARRAANSHASADQ